MTVALECTEDGTVRLRVHDNGIGLPAELDWRQSSSLGLRLVQMLAGQLRATVEAGPRRRHGISSYLQPAGSSEKRGTTAWVRRPF